MVVGPLQPHSRDFGGCPVFGQELVGMTDTTPLKTQKRTCQVLCTYLARAPRTSYLDCVSRWNMATYLLESPLSLSQVARCRLAQPRISWRTSLIRIRLLLWDTSLKSTHVLIPYSMLTAGGPTCCR